MRATDQEVDAHRIRDGLGEQRLAGAGRAVEQHALGRLDADAQEELRILQRQLNDLAQLADLVAETADARERDVARILHRHVVHERIDLARQYSNRRSAAALLTHQACDMKRVARKRGS